MRLIDADKLKEEIEEAINAYHNNAWGGYCYAEDVLDEIDFMPTAYDVDEVIKQLEERVKECKRIITNNYEPSVRHYLEGLEDAIDIVKGGGLND